MAGRYPIAVNGSFVLPTRRPDLNPTVVAGNMAQCKNITASNSTVLPGQFPIAAVDSSNGTSWQPSTSEAAFIIVDLESQQSISRAHINWGEFPAQSFEILLSNDSTTFTSVVNETVQISVPYNVTMAALVEIQLGNTTDVQFNATSGRYFHLLNLLMIRYVQLIINGTLGDPTVGATVAEFAVI
jgi:F5/8 type C domain